MVMFDNIKRFFQVRKLRKYASDLPTGILPLSDIRTVNVVLIGVLSKAMNIPEEEWEKVLRATVPEKAIDVNLKAFRLGRGY